MLHNGHVLNCRSNIPKAAGTTQIPYFTGQFELERIFLCGSKDGGLNDFWGLKQEAREPLEFLVGHVDYGIHHNFQGNLKYIVDSYVPIS